VVFLSLEDETGMVNVICPPHVWERHRRPGMSSAVTAPALVVWGRIERTGAPGRVGGADGAANLIAAVLRPLRVAAASSGEAASRDFR
jgi:error-prone DNA polymerase